MTDHNFYLRDAVHILRSNGTTEHADACEWAARELESLRASLTRVEEERDEARGYLVRNVLEPAGAEPLPTLIGICTQVDHICATGGVKPARLSRAIVEPGK